MTFAKTFYTLYPEFEGKITPEKVESVKLRVKALYSVLQGDGERYELAAAMVTAHYIVVYGWAGEDMSAAAGVLVSSSVGDVSVAFQSKPIDDLFQDFFAGSTYGREFLAWLATVGGITFIN